MGSTPPTRGRRVRMCANPNRPFWKAIMRLFQLRAGKLLQTLQADAILFAEELRSRRHELDLQDFKKDTQDVKTFFNKVKDHEAILGSNRIVRILRHQTPAVRGLDKNKATCPSLEDNICWMEAVQTNNEYELEVIDRNRALILTVISVIAATAAAIASLIALVKRQSSCTVHGVP